MAVESPQVAVVLLGVAVKACRDLEALSEGLGAVTNNYNNNGANCGANRGANRGANC
jgi:hypothetical protein